MVFMEKFRTRFTFIARVRLALLLTIISMRRIDSASYPPYSTRLGMAHLLLELSLHSSALEILQRLENEDDEDGGIWYLSGWAWWLLGEERADVESTGEEESKAECWSESRLCLENYLRVSLSFFSSTFAPHSNLIKNMID
jgi:hypothetical protein